MKPTATVSVVMDRKKYVGKANMLPDSFTPRKLAIAIKTSKPMESKTRKGNRVGKAETICATPEATVTAASKI
jgi:hypothetical protein